MLKLHGETSRMLVTVRFLGVAAFLIATAGNAAGAIVKLSGPVSVHAGSSFSVNVDVESVADLYAAQFSLAFDSSTLLANYVSEGAFLKQGGASTFWNPPAMDNNAGTITGAAVTRLGPVSGVTGSGTIATISFYAKTVGGSALSLNGVLLSDPNAQPISFYAQNASVNIVPPPSAPETWIASGPSGTINTTTATFTWYGIDSDGSIAYYRYMMDAQGWAVTSQTSHTFTGLSKGSHTLYVAAVDNDELADPSPASRSFIVYYTADPDTQIVSGPAGTVQGETAAFEWVGTDPDGWVVSYLYRLDDQGWNRTTRTKHTYANLSHGNHTFWVKAVDEDGLEDPTPATLNFTLIPFWWQEEIARLNGIVGGLQGELESARADLEKVKGEKEGLEQERDQLQGQVNTLQAQKANLEDQVRVLENQRIVLEVEIENLGNTTGRMEATIADLQEQLGSANDRNQALSRQSDGLRGQMSEMQEERDRINSTLETTQREKALLQAQVAALQGQTAYLEQQISGLGDRIANLTTYGQTLMAENKLMREEGVRLEAHLGDLQTQLLNRSAEIAQLREEAAQGQLEMDKLESDRMAAMSENALLERSNQSLLHAKRAFQVALAAMAVAVVILLGMLIRSRMEP